MPGKATMQVLRDLPETEHVNAGRGKSGLALLLMMTLLMALLPATQVIAQGFSGSASVVKPRLVWSTQEARAGGQAVLAVVIDIDEHYHINPDAKQIPKALDFLIPLTVTTSNVPVGVLVGGPQFPKAAQVSFGGQGETIPGYSKQAVIYLPVAIDANYQSDTLQFNVSLNYQSCNETTCLPPSDTELKATLKMVVAADLVVGRTPATSPAASGTNAAGVNSADAALFKDFDATVFADLAGSLVSADESVGFDVFGYTWSYDAATTFGLVMIILMAMLGGLLLNFTPCVLPVIPIKILSLKQAAGGRRKQVMLGISMSLGVIAFWVALGLVMAIATGAVPTGDEESAGGFTSTNQLFQYPWFTIGVGVVIVVMAVGMCGLFAVRLPQWVYKINPGHDSYHGSFGFGVMTAVLSTPCTAPFMGAAAAWAVTQNSWVTLSVFFSIGLGMALPYLVLSANPAWIDRMPRTGPGSELIKQVMGLLLLAAGVFFLGTGISGLLVDPPQPPTRLYWWAVAAMVAMAGAWLIWKILKTAKSEVTKAVFVPLGGLLIVIAIVGGLKFTDQGPIDWTYYTPQQLATAKADGKVVVLEFTAEWCLNCKAMEQSVLASKDVASLLNSDEVAAIKIDLTGNNEMGNALLKQMGRVAIPLLVVMTPDGQIVFKSDFYTVDQVLQAVNKAKAM